MRTAKISIRSTTYHGTEGFSITGKDTLARWVSIFVMRRETAEAIKGRILQGLGFDDLIFEERAPKDSIVPIDGRLR